jgi:glycosyltransferase involved in cell wall biosynthesis
MQLAFVLWSGRLGGAETLCSYLAAELRGTGVDARVVFVGAADPVASRLDDLSVPWHALDLPRGRSVVRRPRTYARALREHGRDAAILMCPRYMATGLQMGGYRGRIVAVEHGDMLLDADMSPVGRRARSMNRTLSLNAVDAEVAVSRFMLAKMRQRRHAAELHVIPNAVATERFRPERDPSREGPLHVGWAGRMIAGKGLDELIAAAELLQRNNLQARIRIAGDGPKRADVQDRIDRRSLGAMVELTGWTQDLPGFWNWCDLAVAPSNQFVESFGMTPLEAAACGRAAVVARNGGLVEVVADGETGAVVEPGNPEALANAIAGYARDRERLVTHGRAARDRATSVFGISRCAADYLAVARGSAPPESP